MSFQMESALHSAVCDNDMPFVVKFLEKQETNQTQAFEVLWLAASEGRADIVQYLIKTHCDPTVQVEMYDAPWKRKPIHLAAGKGHLDVVQLFVEAGVAIDCPDCEARTPLHWAVANGKLNIAQYLIDTGASVHSVQCDGFTLLHSAAWRGDLDMSRFLLSHGADVNRAELLEGMTPFHAACCKTADVVELFLTAGASVNTKTYDLETPLHLAVTAKNEAVVNLLLSSGADVDAKDRKGATPTFLAAVAASLRIWQKLCDYGADINLCNYKGQHALQAPELQSSRLYPEMIRQAIELDTNFLRTQPWVTSQHMFSSHPELFSWVISLSHNPHSLQSICRTTIRSCVQGYKPDNINYLPLPRTIRRYLTIW